MVNTIFLFGYMGAGKTVIGKSLSKSIDYEFYDLDNFIELGEKKKISEIFNDHNEVYFRNLENKYLETLSKKKEKKVISLGGGTPCFESNIDIITNTPDSTTIYLKASVNSLINRLKDGKTKRPVISHLKSDNDLKDFINKHLFERSYYYEKAEIKITTDNLEIIQITNLIKGVLA